ncbi:sensor histidine kinase [Alteraurantiacibacter aquimixticola]|uniref:histidine kinase n=1 Tax=Alteraurantiacibacter aquimixticola TaxID=2489173 RepID=A0A4T3EYR4_9SPHN|nr:HAMP domain-containing sensor histidine kinase [Alteraurantiacibacter aquimixticola]TIX49231.1 HAMP domain-containing histidine kinase [Alteraurantiacibacter aquimixticola]
MSRPLPPFGSLRLRFMLAIGLWVSLGILGIWFTATQVFSRHIEESYHEELEVHVRELARLTEIGPDGVPMLSRPLSDPRYEVPLSGFYWQVSIPDRTTLKSESMTRGELDQRVAHSPDIAHVVEDGPTGPAITYGMIEEGPAGEEVHIVIATDQSELDNAIASFTRELTVWLVALAGLLLATGLAIISFGLRPLNRLGIAINRLRGGSASRLEGSYPAEITPLVSDLNAYIAQTSALVERGKVQAGNLAHSLRTPLAVVTDEAERLSENSQCADSARVLLEQSERMQQQIDYQLARARSAAMAKLPGSMSVLPTLARPILQAMTRLHPDIRFTAPTNAGEISLPVDPVVLSELLSILLDNAGKWAREEVQLSYTRDPAGAVTITIADDGPGMTEEQIARACDIGTRFDPATPGSGLGLAIAREICADLGCEFELTSKEGGLVARLTFANNGGK